MKNNPKFAVWLVSAALLVVLSVAALFTFFGQLKDAAQMRQHTFITLNHAQLLLSSLKDAETGQRGFLLTGDEAFLQPYLAVRDNITNQLQQLQQLATIPAAQAHLDTIAPLVERKLVGMARLIALARDHDMTAVTTDIRGAEGKRLMDSIRVEMDAFTQIEEAALKLYDTEFQAQMRHLFAIIIFASLFVLLFAVAFVYSIYRNTQQQLKNLGHSETQRLLDAQETMNQQLKQAYNTLQDSEEKLGVTLNSIGDAVIATDANACVTMLNPIAEDLTGWTQAQAFGRPVAEILHIINKDTREFAVIPVMETLEHGTIQGLANHTVLVARDKREFDIADSCAPIRDRDGEVIGAVLVFRDVSKEYVVQQALHDSNALIQTVLNTVADGIVTFHACSGLLETINPAAEQLFGYSNSELIGQPFSVVIPTFDEDQCNVCLNHSQSSDEPQANSSSREVIGRCKDGSSFPLEMTIREMWLGDKRYFTGILRDISTRKQVAEALLKAGALQNAIFNSANFSSIATDASGVIQIFNVGAERMLGYAAVDVMDKITPADISDPQEVIQRATTLSTELDTTITPGFEALVFKALRGIEDIYELTYIRKDGSRFPAVVSVTALRDVNETIIGYLLIGTDNTARKQAEEALLKAGALQSAIFNSANFSSIATDAKGVIQIFNVGAERMLGYTAAEVMNKITPADISDPQEVIQRATTLSTELDTTITPGFEALVFKASRGIEDIYELTYIRKDGSRFPAVVSVTALRDVNETIIGYLLIGTDNTARKQVEAEQKKLDQRLRDQQFYTRSLIESNIDALMATDPAGIITDANKQMEALTGCTRDELIGAPFKNYFTDPERAEAAIKRVLSENKITNYELTARARDGKETVVSYNATTFYDRDRNLQGVFAAARDITERKRLDQVLEENNIELETAKSIAEKANLAKSDFLSSMSHELRTPLNAILGFAQLIESDAPTPIQKRSLDQILQAGWYLLELINEILDLALIESGKLSLVMEPVSLADVMRECETMIEPQAQKRGISVTFSQVNTMYSVHADHTRVKQVLINLLSNAIKYNKIGGTVVLTCNVQSQGRLRVCIEDSGEGLSSDQIAQLFQPFNRLGQESNAEEGTGIGLVITKRLIELMGGAIGLESTVGKGSVFWIEMNLTAKNVTVIGASKPVYLQQPQVKADASLYTLLYVEDNPANLMLIEDLIARRPDIYLLTARDGNSGVALARSALPDLILMDINLPGISGIEALKLLSEDPNTAHIPVVALSANAIPRDIEKGLQAGFFRYLTKPIKVNELMQTLDIALKYAATETVKRNDVS